MEHLVSVVIPAYNHEQYVQETIKSVIKQTYKNIELIIVDDGSTDNTWKKINEMKDVCEKRFKRVVFETQQNEGTCTTLNQLIKSTQGEYVHAIASDDKFAPKATELLEKFLSQNPDYALAVGNNEFIDECGKKCFWDANQNNVYTDSEAVDRTFGEHLEKRKTFKLTSTQFGTYNSLYRENYIPNGCLIRKSIFEKILPFTKEAPLEDWFLMLQISKYAKMKYIDEILFSYRWHGANSIKQGKKMTQYFAKTRDYEAEIIKRIDKTKLLKDVVSFIEYKLKEQSV